MTLVINVVGDILSMTTAIFLTTDGRVSVPLKLVIHQLSDAPWNSCFLRVKLFDNLSNCSFQSCLILAVLPAVKNPMLITKLNCKQMQKIRKDVTVTE